MTLLPLLGLPLWTRRYERYLLLIPYILVNLLSDYRYQHDIFYQYTFGSNAFLLYLTMANLADLKTGLRGSSIGRRSGCLRVCFCAVIVPKAVKYPAEVLARHGFYQEIRHVLDTIPEEAPVTATTFYTTYLSRRKILYDVRYSSQEHLLETEYVVLALPPSSDYKNYEDEDTDNGFENLVKLLEENGYREWKAIEDVLVIYHKEAS